jgi:hypothetical protein
MTEGGLRVGLHLLYISPEAFHRSPQVGVPCVMPWESLAAYLSRPSVGEEKGCAGGYALGRYVDNMRRKQNLVTLEAVVLDFDESAVGAVAAALGRYSTITHETFSSRDEAPRCRALVRLSAPIDGLVYEKVHAILRAKLRAAGLPPDEGAKDPCRLSYSPVRRTGAAFRFNATEGELLDAAAVLAAQPPAPPRAAPQIPRPEHRDAYAREALRRASSAVSSGNPGERHYTLSKEAFTLTRLGLREDEIASALLPAFVAAAGEPRRHEGERTIADAIRARRGEA